MQLNFPDYTKLVTAAYYKKLANRELRFVSQSSPAKLKRECLDICRRGYLKKDEQTLINFFGQQEEDRPFLLLIRKTEREKFKPLDNYLRKSTEKTDDKNIDLLAWLIDFQHRPFALGMNVILNEEEHLIISEPLINTKAEPINLEQEEEKLAVNVTAVNNTESKKIVTEPEKNEPQTSVGRVDDIPVNDPNSKPVENPLPAPPGIALESKKWSKGRKRSVTIALILMFFTGSIYTTWQLMEQQSECMYWNGDQYVPVPCNEEPDGRIFLPLDVKKMKNFERITRKDTITERSIGKIFYIKDSNRIEYYTYSGNYPDDLKRYVKKLSRRIFEKDSMNRKSP